VWYFCRPFTAFPVDLIENPSFAHELVDRIGAFNLAAAKRLLECGVRAISYPDDLGHNRGTFFSPKIYRLP
jgi:uroporphyrinogen-III decarboxylase